MSAYESDTVAEEERRAPAKRETAVRIRPVSSVKGETMSTFELVERGTILRATVGSTVHGLRRLRPAILSARAGRGYLGYLKGRKERLLGTRGQKRVNRPELVEAHGFDTKYAMHALRLGYQGLELLESGMVTLPMPEPARSSVMPVRLGERSFDDAIGEIEEVERRLEAALERTSLPGQPDEDAVNTFLVDSYRRAWGWQMDD
jgi:hypothetical protein